MIKYLEYSIPIKLGLKNPLVDLNKLKIIDNEIHYFIYQQDSTKQYMKCKNTRENQCLIAWIQIHDSKLTGSSVEELERKT